MSKILGIDPGLKGGIALLEDKKIVTLNVMPVFELNGKHEYNITEIINIIKYSKPDEVIIERQQAMPGQGVSSMFKIGLGYGILQGVVLALGYKLTIVQAKSWQKKMFVGLNTKDSKGCSKLICIRNFPETTFKETPRCKNMHDGLTDATCIALSAFE